MYMQLLILTEDENLFFLYNLFVFFVPHRRGKCVCTETFWTNSLGFGVFFQKYLPGLKSAK
jgi:hypothetical protein